MLIVIVVVQICSSEIDGKLNLLDDQLVPHAGAPEGERRNLAQIPEILEIDFE